MKNLLILGCGWLGEELARDFKTKGWQVWVTTRSEEKYHRFLNDGISAIIHDYDHQERLDLPVEVHFDVILNSIPASQKNSVDEIQTRFNRVFNSLSAISYDQHIFLSSIGVYPNLTGIYEESYSDERLMSPTIRVAELTMITLPYTSIFRLGGLFGKNRIFAKYFQDKIVEIGDQLANFVHLEDIIEIFDQFINNKNTTGYYNIVCPEHPQKKEVILASAQKYIFSYPQGFKPQNSFQKLVSSNKIIELLNYTFKYSSPIDF